MSKEPIEWHFGFCILCKIFHIFANAIIQPNSFVRTLGIVVESQQTANEVNGWPIGYNENRWIFRIVHNWMQMRQWLVILLTESIWWQYSRCVSIQKKKIITKYSSMNKWAVGIKSLTYDNDLHIFWYDDDARKFDRYGVRKSLNASGILIAFRHVASNTTWESCQFWKYKFHLNH